MLSRFVAQRIFQNNITRRLRHKPTHHTLTPKTLNTFHSMQLLNVKKQSERQYFKGSQLRKPFAHMKSPLHVLHPPLKARQSPKLRVESHQRNRIR